MSFTTPATQVAGTILTAGWLNTYVRDNVAWLATDSPTCRAYHNTTQSINDTTDTQLVFNSERYDNAAMHSTSSLTSRITVPTGGAGKYLMGFTMSWESNATGYRIQGIQVNASGFIGDDSRMGVTGATTRIFASTAYALSAADYLEVRVTQNSGGARTVASQEFWAAWVRT